VAASRKVDYINLMLTMLLGVCARRQLDFFIWAESTVRAGHRALVHGAREVLGSSANFIARWGRRIIIFNLVCLAWIFFRVPLSPALGNS